MKKSNLLILAGVALVITAVYAGTQIKETAAGTQIATTADQKLAFWGATPVTQQWVTVSADSTTLTNILLALVRNGIVRTN